MQYTSLFEKLSCKICEFIEASFHIILCSRGVYPEESFRRIRKFGSFIWWSKSQDVSSYLSELTESLRELIYRGILSKIVMVLFDSQNTAVGKYVFEFNEIWKSLSVSSIDELYVEENFRNGFTRLEMSTTLLNYPMIQCHSFEVFVQTYDCMEIQNGKLGQGSFYGLKEQEAKAKERMLYQWLPSSDPLISPKTVNLDSSADSDGFTQEILNGFLRYPLKSIKGPVENIPSPLLQIFLEEAEAPSLVQN